MREGAITMAPAIPADEPDLRRLLRETPIAGALSLSLEREPDLLHAAAIEGDRHRFVAGRTGEGRIVGMAARSVREVWVNGAPARLGYLGQLRAAGEGRGRIRAMREGFALLAADRRPDELPFDLTSVVLDNAPARRLLEAGVAGFPTYRPLGELVTLALVPRDGRTIRRAGVTLQRGSPDRLGEIAQLLGEEGSRRQFAERVTAGRLACPSRSRGLSPADFHLAIRDGRLVGCAALWDQRSFKQTVVRGYSRPLALVRPMLALAGPALGLPRLPPIGAPLAAAFLAFVAVPGDDPEVLDVLLASALADARARGLDQLLLARAAADPLLAVARRRAHRPYRSMLYAVHAPSGAGAEAAARLDGRPLGPEVATL
jgi:hypothetical protein